MDEYNEPIVLSEVEYDILKSYIGENSMALRYTIGSFALLDDMKQKGYFKGIDDTAMSIKEILEN